MQSIFYKKSLIFSSLFLLVSVLALLFLLSSIRDNEIDYKVAQEKWQTENIRREGIKALTDFFKRIEPKKNMLDEHFIESTNVVPFLDTLEDLAKKVNVKLEVNSVNIEEKEPALLVEIKTSGSFGNIYKLVTLLENSPYSLVFVSANIKSTGDPTLNKISQTPQWIATFQMKLLSFTK